MPGAGWLDLCYMAACAPCAVVGPDTASRFFIDCLASLLRITGELQRTQLPCDDITNAAAAAGMRGAAGDSVRLVTVAVVPLRSHSPSWPAPPGTWCFPWCPRSGASPRAGVSGDAAQACRLLSRVST